MVKKIEGILGVNKHRFVHCLSLTHVVLDLG
jgi:hypothetical protein